jgi:hypothetical protein
LQGTFRITLKALKNNKMHFSIRVFLVALTFGYLTFAANIRSSVRQGLVESIPKVTNNLKDVGLDLVKEEIKTLGVNHDPNEKYDDQGKSPPASKTTLKKLRKDYTREERERKGEKHNHRFCKKGHKGPISGCPLAQKWSEWVKKGKIKYGKDTDFTVPANVALVLDVPSVEFHRLYILGTLSWFTVFFARVTPQRHLNIS